MKRWVWGALIALVAVIGIVVSQTDAGQLLLGRWSFTKSVDVNKGYFFRLKVSLAYKGEPQDFDIVVGCNVRLTTYKDNSNTYEAGLVPTVFGRRMSDGAGLVIRPPDACRGQTTANGKVPKEFIPLIIVYDDADTLAFGTAYATEDAYHNPLSVLTFTRATIETATRADFDAFRARETNIVTPQMYFGMSPPELKKRNLPPPQFMFGEECHGYARYRFVGDARAIVHGLWPSDHPRYWSPDTDGQDAIRAKWPAEMMLSDRESAKPQSGRELFASYDDPAETGIATLDGAHPITSPARIPATVYPDAGGWIKQPWPKNPAEAGLMIQSNGPRVGASIDYRKGATLGFAYCYLEPGWYPTNESVGGDRPRTLLAKYNSLPGNNFVDQSVVVQKKRFAAPIIIERDEFLFHLFKFSLNSTRGDV
jgi:hypothetical protein